MGSPLSIRRSQGRKLFQQRLLTWYGGHKRDLPWRGNRDPYQVWLSEIMLQQTRVAAVIEYYRRFLARFPTIEALAAAQEGEVLAAWSGLGYYRRARMLHAAARKISQEFSGKFPTTALELRQLPGIGRYTAAAVASIAFDECVAVVDGNVERVLQRITGTSLEGEPLWGAASVLVTEVQPGDWNQAMMELGATICLPRSPVCFGCPVVDFCATRGAARSRPRAARRKKEIHYALNWRKRSVFLVQRPRNESLMPGMWELPQIEADYAGEPWLSFRHSITVTDYTVRVVRNLALDEGRGKWITESRIEALPLTGLARKILRAAEIV